ncbi:MAG TPA: hypothetical protein VF682_23210 [Pseudomonas sp.]|jgi:hypothetical protein
MAMSSNPLISQGKVNGRMSGFAPGGNVAVEPVAARRASINQSPYAWLAPDGKNVGVIQSNEMISITDAGFMNHAKHTGY